MWSSSNIVRLVSVVSLEAYLLLGIFGFITLSPVDLYISLSFLLQNQAAAWALRSHLYSIREKKNKNTRTASLLLVIIGMIFPVWIFVFPLTESIFTAAFFMSLIVSNVMSHTYVLKHRGQDADDLLARKNNERDLFLLYVTVVFLSMSLSIFGFHLLGITWLGMVLFVLFSMTVDVSRFVIESRSNNEALSHVYLKRLTQRLYKMVRLLLIISILSIPVYVVLSRMLSNGSFT